MLGRTRILPANTLMDVKVHNNANEDLGLVEELMIDLETGAVRYAIIGLGGFLGLGEKMIAVPWSALTWSPNEEMFIADFDRAKLESAPSFDRNHWPDMTDLSWGTSIHDYYGVAPWWM